MIMIYVEAPHTVYSAISLTQLVMWVCKTTIKGKMPLMVVLWKVCEIWFQCTHTLTPSLVFLLDRITVVMKHNKPFFQKHLNQRWPLVAVLSLFTRWHRQMGSTFGGWNISTSLFTAMCVIVCCWGWGSRAYVAPVSIQVHHQMATQGQYPKLNQFILFYWMLVWYSTRCFEFNSCPLLLNWLQAANTQSMAAAPIGTLLLAPGHMWSQRKKQG